MKLFCKKSVLAVMSALLVLTAAGCGNGDKKTEKTAVTETLKPGTPKYCDSLEPAGNDCGWQVLCYGVGETLVRFDENMKLTPWIAESWKVSDDKLSWTFKIRDIKFSNGNKVTGDAVKKSLERALKKSARARAMLDCDSITADGQEVIVKTKKPAAILPGILGDPLFVVVDVDEEGKRDFSRLGPICTGPYVVTGHDGNNTELAPNTDYWDGKVPFKKVIITAVNDPHTRALALQKGEIHMASGIAAGDMELFKDSSKFSISRIPSVRAVVAQLNVREGRSLSDIRIRQALMRSLDRESYSKVLLRDTFIPGGPVIPPSADFGFDTIKKLDRDQYDVESAKKLLSEAGWKDTNGDGYVDKNGKNLELDFVFPDGLAELPLFAEATRSDAKRVGIKVNLKNTGCNDMDTVSHNGGYDILLSNMLTVQAGDPEVFLKMHWKGNGDGNNPQNGSGYSSPEYDVLSDKLSREFDPAKRRTIIMEMQKILLKDAAVLVFGYPQTNLISTSAIANAKIHPCDFYWLTKEIVTAAGK